MNPIGPGLTVRPAGPADAWFLRKLFDDVRATIFAPLGEAAGPLLDMQFRAQQAQYDADHPDRLTYVVQNGDELVAGYTLVEGGDLATDGTDGRGWRRGLRLVDLAVLSGFRGQGIGSAILTYLQSTQESITLSVAADNRAIRLYERMGFRLISENGYHVGMEWLHSESTR